MLAFWTVMSFGFVGRYQRFAEKRNPEDGDSIFLKNVGTYLKIHMA
jgi:hypothetical protein